MGQGWRGYLINSMEIGKDTGDNSIRCGAGATPALPLLPLLWDDKAD